MNHQVLIIGGGASGLAAGIQAARIGAQVTILEHMSQVGKKLLSTGNGKCNLTNLRLDASCYHSENPRFPMEALNEFPVEKTLKFFRSLGILTKEKQGYVYPNSEQASAVRDVLRLEAEHLNITIVCDCNVKTARKNGKRFEVTSSAGRYPADALILATGSKAAPVTGSDGSGYRLAEEFGHHVRMPLPALVPICCRGREYKQLAGVRTEAELTLLVDGKKITTERGELQLTEYGISGIPTFQLSHYVSKALQQHRNVIINIDFLPELTEREGKEFLTVRKMEMGFKTGEDFLVGVVNRKLLPVLLKRSGISAREKADSISEASLLKLLDQLKHFEACVEAVKPAANAQICCGGVDTTEINGKTMESKLVKGLYLVGELLDVDGICGGYNLQWAWSSGCLAGIHGGK